ncbi:cytochrome c oxidase assembly factor COX20 lethal (3) 87Df [Tachypleus tridentatus]|uniref:cytochrome c oxidase assembly factor COX20 lethal (3) 87Df n=1 Tax=Tachypleus tridentatus TaxID=6853 RepID=UPI003FD681BD
MSSEKERKFIFFGRNVEEIPCFKSSFMTGILSGLGIGLGTFLATSRVKRSADFGFYSFITITLVYWSYCRYKWSKDRFYYRQIQGGLQKAAVLEGTEKDPNVTIKLDEA